MIYVACKWRGEVSDGGGVAVGCGKNSRQNREITVVVA